MQELDLDTLLFFDGHHAALDLYQTFEPMLLDAFPNVNKRVQKTQITFYNRHVFACVSFARVKRKAELPGGIYGNHAGASLPAGFSACRGEGGALSGPMDAPYRHKPAGGTG